MGKGDWQPFVYGGLASCTAEFGTFPIDTAKTRLQIQGQVHDSKHAKLKYRGMLDAFIQISRTEGVGALYAGIYPAVLRQAVYGTIKFGTYYSLKNLVKQGNGAKEDVTVNVCCAVVAGMVSSAIANPTDVLKVRMQVLGSQCQRGLIGCFQDVYHNEGIAGLWRGVGPTAQRAAVIAAVELPVYDFCKQQLMNTFGNHISNHFMLLSQSEHGKHRPVSLHGHSFHLPFPLVSGQRLVTDVIPEYLVFKTRLMNQKKLKNTVVNTSSLRIYAGSIDCLTQTVKHEGFLALYKGFIPTWVRMGPWNIIFFITYEQLKKLH